MIKWYFHNINNLLFVIYEDVKYMKSLFNHFEVLDDPRDIRGKKASIN